MVSQKVKVGNPSGLHLRPATLVSNGVLRFQSQIQFEYERDGLKGIANMKSILNILAARIQCGQEIEVICQGEDEEEALTVAVGLLSGKLS